jgi:hypothetical protein
MACSRPGKSQAILQGRHFLEQMGVLGILSRKFPPATGGETWEAERKEAAESGGNLENCVHSSCNWQPVNPRTL